MCGGTCSKCNVRLSPRDGLPSSFHIDHVVPYSRGGGDDLTNLQPLCRTCNTSKGNRSSHDYRPSHVRERYAVKSAHIEDERLTDLHRAIVNGVAGLNGWYTDPHIRQLAHVYAENFCEGMLNKPAPALRAWVSSYWPDSEALTDYVAAYAAWVLHERRPSPPDDVRRQLGSGVEQAMRTIQLRMPLDFYKAEDLRINLEEQMIQMLIRDGRIDDVGIEAPNEQEGEYWPRLVKKD